MDLPKHITFLHSRYNHRMKKTALVLLVVLLTACQPAPPATVPPVPELPTDASPVAVETTALPAVTPAAPQPLAGPQPPGADQPRYQINAVLDDSLHSLQVVEEIRFTNPSGSALESLPLAVEANRYPGAFEWLGASADEGEITLESLDANQLRVRLAPALAAGTAMTLRLEYRLQLPPIQTGQPHIFGYTQRQINLADWYPSLPPFSPVDGWLLHPPGAVGEHGVYPAADFDVELYLPSVQPALVVAASAPGDAVQGGYHYHLEGTRNFVWSASQEYVVSTQQAGDTRVTSYAYPATELAARAALDYTVQALNYFSKQFGMPPRGSLSIVQADFPDGMEYDGLFFLSDRFYYGFDGSPRSYLALIAVHETAHQWWYGRVGSDQALEPWLDEALCTYSELLFYESLNPELADWWWGFRVESHAPKGSLSATIYDFSRFTPYRNLVYLRGAQFLHALRQAMGDVAFFNALQTYLARFDGQIATRSDFLDAVQQATSKDLSASIADAFKP